ncbi:MAG: ROK family protein, partial [Bacteroidota bacterium]|nr:ROK family protein [Bacteroidota bacterium]
NLAEALKSYSDLPIYIENDANLMGLGEATFGIARGMTDVIFLTVGTGIGGAMLLNGKLYSGYRNRGSEIGHFPINSEGRMCNCGMRGCLEAHASTTALITDYLELAEKNGIDISAEDINGKYITEKYFSGEPTALEAFNLHFEYLSRGISGLINVFSPQLIVIGGGISEAGSFYIEEIAKRVDRYALKSCSELTKIERATLGNKAGCLGAAALVLSNL